ncbi:cytochrome c [Rubripirellula sp.]|jgi:mono/diheme cytochrome c family protein|nr:cytochrome c [Rubripirellula sp.]MDB4749268.1 cytochrome c [Rubripirellula sp.]
MLFFHPTKRLGLLAASSLTVFVLGCSTEVKQPVVFEPNLVHTMKYEIQKEIPMDEASKDSTWVVNTMFGSPDAPTLPAVLTEDEDLASIISMDHLVHASGPATEQGRGLFRAICSTCHGITGNGRGKDASSQNPYPRDYRMGIFKFKSNSRGDKPTKEDLARLIRDGISGTNMHSAAKLLETENFRRKQDNEPPLEISEITNEDIDALVDYVMYLSLRGEHERQQVDMGILEQILEDGERLINSDFGNRVVSNGAFKASLEEDGDKEDEVLTEETKANLELYERYQEDWEYAEEYAAEIAEAWLDGADAVLKIPDPPASFPLAENASDVAALRSGDQAKEFVASVKRGQELFVGKIASCSKCHGEKGLGNGQTTDYDDWTKDWTTRVDLKPENREDLIPLMARGALPPVNIIPRNFAEGVFRGGSESKHLYRRITQGIDGTPMPAATFVEGKFDPVDVWHLINFIRSLQTPDSSSESPTSGDSSQTLTAAP